VISIFHACLAQTFFSLVVGLAYVYSGEWSLGGAIEDQKSTTDTDALERLLFVTIALVFTQLVLGAAVRHTHNRYILIPHIACAFLVVVHAALILRTGLADLAKVKAGASLAIGFSVLSVIQVFLGMGSFIFVYALPASLQPSFGKIFFVTAHQSMGALLLAGSVLLFLKVKRHADLPGVSLTKQAAESVSSVSACFGR